MGQFGRGSFGGLRRSEYRLDKVSDTAGEVDPGAGHEAEALTTSGGEGVILAGVSGIGFDPLGGEEGVGLEAIEDGIDGAFGEDELRVRFEEADDLQTVEATGPQAGEGCHLKRTLTELGLPAVWCVAAFLQNLNAFHALYLA
jgi:hypothetical protein